MVCRFATSSLCAAIYSRVHPDDCFKASIWATANPCAGIAFTLHLTVKIRAGQPGRTLPRDTKHAILRLLSRSPCESIRARNYQSTRNHAPDQTAQHGCQVAFVSTAPRPLYAIVPRRRSEVVLIPRATGHLTAPTRSAPNDTRPTSTVQRRGNGSRPRKSTMVEMTGVLKTTSKTTPPATLPSNTRPSHSPRDPAD